MWFGNRFKDTVPEVGGRYEWRTKAVKRGGKIVTNTGEALIT